MSASHDEEYAAVVERERPLTPATAYLLTGDPAQAERVVQLVFRPALWALAEGAQSPHRRTTGRRERRSGARGFAMGGPRIASS